jgi:type I restriction enzyme, R subunit
LEPGLNKKTLSEADICAKFITPALIGAGWSEVEQVFREYTLRPGRVVVQGSHSRRDKGQSSGPTTPCSTRPAWRWPSSRPRTTPIRSGQGCQQAIGYAELLSVHFSFSSNGDGFVFRDATLASGTLEITIGLDEFPSPAELWDRDCAWKGWKPDVREIIEQAYSPSKTTARPRATTNSTPSTARSRRLPMASSGPCW